MNMCGKCNAAVSGVFTVDFLDNVPLHFSLLLLPFGLLIAWLANDIDRDNERRNADHE